MKAKETKYYHENSNVASFKRVENSNGFSYEHAYDKKGNVLTFKNSDGDFRIKGKKVTKEKYDNFINTLNN